MRTPTEIAEAFSPATRITAEKPFYLVGIGGAGMSALAVMLQKRGIPVSGSDSTESSVTVSLREAGIPVRIGHSGEDIQTGWQVVLSDAIDLRTSPEVEMARNLGCDLFRRSQLLSWLLKGKKVIAVTGTHGKTTVTGMIGAGLRAAGMDPTIVVGAYVPEFGGAVVEGEGEYAVVEACEAYNAFLDLEPWIVVLTNLEPDHLDFHGSFEKLRKSVEEFVGRLPESGFLVFCDDDAGSQAVAKGVFVRTLPYRLSDMQKIAHQNGGMLMANSPLGGAHNQTNAAAALTVAEIVGADEYLAREGISAFRGAERRLQFLQRDDAGISVIDDYAHHPTEVLASLSAIRERHASNRIVVAFQPHLYSRTAQFIPEFAKALSLADVVFLTDIYPAREDPIPGISSARIAELIEKPTYYVPSRHLLPREVAKFAQKGDVVVGMGAGNISEFAPAFIAELNRAEQAKKRVAVILGGDSAEREVSLHSGRAVLDALKSLGYDAFALDVTEALLGKADLRDLIGSNRPDLAFLATHGTNQEDGALQGLFELLHIPYTGSGIQASSLAMDKRLTKIVVESQGIPTPRGQVVTSPVERIEIEPPLIVKPNAQGSTVGLSFVHNKEEIKPAIERALHYDKMAIVEEWVQGMEITVPVLGGKALPSVEIVPKEGHYDFANKYIPGATEEISPARLPADVLAKASDYAEGAHKALGCEGATRSDFIVRDNKDPIFLELNTLPGLTGTSLLPNSANAAGMSFEALVDWIVQDALTRNAAKS